MGSTRMYSIQSQARRLLNRGYKMRLEDLEDDEEQEGEPWEGKYYVIVTLTSERQQRQLLDQLIEEDYDCRALTSPERSS